MHMKCLNGKVKGIVSVHLFTAQRQPEADLSMDDSLDLVPGRNTATGGVTNRECAKRFGMTHMTGCRAVAL